MVSLKVKTGNKCFQVKPGTTLYEVSRLVKEDYTYPIIAAKLNNSLVDLSKAVTTNSIIEFYDRSSVVGNRVYARSLEFLVTVAAKKVLKADSEVLIDYSLDNGIYCEVIGQRINQKTIESIENVMHDMVKDRLKIRKAVVSRIDAINYFNKHKNFDKVENLRYTTNSTISLHVLDNNYDYYFGPLVHDTGQINLFKLLYLKDNSFIMTFPNKRKPKTVTEYTHHKLLFEEYKNFEEWCKKVHLYTAPELNRLSSENKTIEAIRLAEAYYEHQVTMAANKVYKKKEKIKLILLSGPSSSGKTTTARKLQMALKVLGLTPHMISLDDYFIDRDKSPKDENGEYDFSSIKVIDQDLLNKNLKDLLDGKEVKLPSFDFVKGKQEYNGQTLKLEEDDVLIIEGIHAFNDNLIKSVPRENKFKVFISPLTSLKIDNHNRVHTSDIRKLRRIVRDSKFRGFPAIETLKGWANVVKETHERVYPFEDDADTIINTALNYELGVLRIYAEPLLYAINENNEYYPEVARLINLLRNFLPISSEGIPKDSLLREFIGGGIYEEEQK